MKNILCITLFALLTTFATNSMAQEKRFILADVGGSYGYIGKGASGGHVISYGGFGAIHYLSGDWSFGFHFGYAEGNETWYNYQDKLDYENQYKVYSYLLVTRYYFTGVKVRPFIGFTIGANTINLHNDFQQTSQTSKSTTVGIPVGVNWMISDHFHATAFYQASVIVGKSLYISGLVNTFSVGIGYNFGLKPLTDD